jgi:hypothetical protein
MLLEVLRSARLEEARLLEAQFATLPCLPTPKDLWQRAIALGQACRQVGRTVLSLDLLVAAVDVHHNAVLVSCEANVEAIASVSDLRLQRLERPSLIRRLPSRSTSACRAIHRSNTAGCSLLEATSMRSLHPTPSLASGSAAAGSGSPAGRAVRTEATHLAVLSSQARYRTGTAPLRRQLEAALATSGGTP